jgi:hypothetical protein
VLRENLVGVVMRTPVMEGDSRFSEEEILITDFAGEGADSVVYAIAPLSTPEKDDRVIKFLKPVAFLEMETLHHSFRVDELRYPHHPLRMGAAERLTRLTDEMLRRIDDQRLLFRIGPYRELLDKSIAVLALTSLETFRAGGPLAASLDVSPVRPWIHENLAYRIGDLLDEDRIIDDAVPFYERVLAEIPLCIERWTAEGTYAPLPANPLVNLVGLYHEDFVNHEELRHLSRTPEFSDRIGSSATAGLFDLIATLYFHLKGQTPSDRSGESPESRWAQGKWRQSVGTLALACDTLEDVANRGESRSEHFVGLARAWKGYARMLEGARIESVVPLLRSALEAFDDPACARDRHDALLRLGEVLQHADPVEASRCVEEAARIREALRGP